MSMQTDFRFGFYIEKYIESKKKKKHLFLYDLKTQNSHNYPNMEYPRSLNFFSQYDNFVHVHSYSKNTFELLTSGRLLGLLLLSGPGVLGPVEMLQPLGLGLGRRCLEDSSVRENEELESIGGLPPVFDVNGHQGVQQVQRLKPVAHGPSPTHRETTSLLMNKNVNFFFWGTQTCSARDLSCAQRNDKFTDEQKRKLFFEGLYFIFLRDSNL